LPKAATSYSIHTCIICTQTRERDEEKERKKKQAGNSEKARTWKGETNGEEFLVFSLTEHFRIHGILK
jgi:hypothetical protein